MKKLLVVALAALSLTACGQISRSTASLTGHSIECVDGVSYIQFVSGVTVQYDRDGKIKTCGK